MEVLKNVINGVLDLVYPKKINCLYCGTPLKNFNDHELCGYCISLLPVLGEGVCNTCGRPLEREERAVCEDCKDAQFDKCLSVFEFSGIAKDMLHRFKYDGEDYMSHPIGLFMAEKLKSKSWDVDIIIPVPLHSDKLKERGYNQSYLLAEVVGRECDIDVLNGGLIRNRYTKSQFNLSKTERRNNIKGAFEIGSAKKIKGSNILLIDDIMTTGATLNECSSVLKSFGARKIYCLTAATPSSVK
ncbi:amidophosphoribosyltransferase [Oxobacter pfennigii]|uniref:Amidophosphoribosyltransferase n=1 Tax=Oxobacter pfennigii TaxID=36849 RepID=A0A0P8W7T4_9CLOT|nr:ComF family protein [Oxobacter pfennigii]KPU44729.1 amidophosphoribosyltransferase [Oxobacter pfennigii]